MTSGNATLRIGTRRSALTRAQAGACNDPSRGRGVLRDRPDVNAARHKPAEPLSLDNPLSSNRTLDGNRSGM
jgi:hypothetical protein